VQFGAIAAATQPTEPGSGSDRVVCEVTQPRWIVDFCFLTITGLDPVATATPSRAARLGTPVRSSVLM